MYETTLIYRFEKKGVLQNIDEEDSIINDLKYNTYQYLKNENIMHSGMIPKLDICFKALKQGIKDIIISNPHIISNLHLTHTHISI